MNSTFRRAPETTPEIASEVPGTPQQPIAMAALRIGVHIPDSAPYFEAGHQVDRAEFEGLVWNELATTVPSNVWTLWESIPLPQPHPTEVQVRSAIVGALKVFNNHPQTDTTLFLSDGNTTANPTRVRYVWRDGRFVRVHSYALDRGGAGQAWLITHHPSSGGPVIVHLQARLSWTTDV